MKHPCPVCHYPNLTEPPRSPGGGASYEICPRCGFQFGVSDDDRGFTYSQWRATWKQGGAKWASQQPPPPGDAAAQLASSERTSFGKKRRAAAD